jgi:hypothetical protein
MKKSLAYFAGTPATIKTGFCDGGHLEVVVVDNLHVVQVPANHRRINFFSSGDGDAG